MNDKIETSIQYQLTNAKLFNEVYLNWDAFSAQLDGGPEGMKKYFIDQWNEVKNVLMQNPNLNVTDLNRTVTENDFDVQFNTSLKDIPVFYFIFPKYDGIDAASVFVALALCKEMPRYFTLECHQNTATNQKAYVLGEFYVDFDKQAQAHKNYGQVGTDVDVVKFSDLVEEIIDKEDK